MARTVAATFAALLFVPLMASAATTRAADFATVTSSTSRAGARPVAFTFAIHTELQCGRLRPGTTVTIAFPVQARVPTTMSADAATVSGKAAAQSRISGHTVTITPPRPAGMTCMAIAPGTATLTLTRTAGIGNPPAPGRYRISLHIGDESLLATYAVR